MESNKEEEKFLVEGEFIMSSYDPPKLLKGMTFVTKVVAGLPEPELLFFTLWDDNVDKYAFMAINGAPVTLNIITTGKDGEIIALQDEIGLFDGNGDLRNITDHEINVIINQYDGVMNIECDKTGDPILYDGKVIISYLVSLESEEEDNQQAIDDREYRDHTSEEENL
jgi:hypothetical protein